MKYPTVHLNGTSKGELLEQLQNAGAACRTAIQAVGNAAPNARDYYVQDAGAYTIAVAEHTRRLERLHAVHHELSEIANQVAMQKGGRP